MKLVSSLRSDVINKVIELVAGAFGYEIVKDAMDADVIIANDPRLMLSMLKKGKKVIQFLDQPSDEPATGLLTAYPDQFVCTRVVAGKGVEGAEALIARLLKLVSEEAKEKRNEGSGS